MKVKLDDYEVRVLINGLIQQHRSYDAETNGQIDSLALRLCDIAETMKPGRKKKNPLWAGRNQSNLSVPYGVAKSRDTGEKTRRSGCYK